MMVRMNCERLIFEELENLLYEEGSMPLHEVGGSCLATYMDSRIFGCVNLPNISNR